MFHTVLFTSEQVFQPFEDRVLNTVEVLSEVTLVIILQLAMLWRDTMFSQPNRGAHVALVVAFFTVNALLLSVFAVVIARSLGKDMWALLRPHLKVQQRKAQQRKERDINSACTTHFDARSGPHSQSDMQRSYCNFEIRPPNRMRILV